MPATLLEQVQTAPHLEPQSPRLASATRQLRIERLQAFDGTVRSTRTLGSSSNVPGEQALKMRRWEQLSEHDISLYTHDFGASQGRVAGRSALRRHCESIFC